jgi:ABC-type Fe3+ transport system substrate-binding protein
MENELDKQTTAVEWLVKKLQESGIPLMTDEFEMIQQAKEMENAQKAHSFHLGMEAQRLINKGKNGE